MRGALPAIGVAALAAGLWLASATAPSSPELEAARPPLVYDFFSYYRPNAVHAAARLRAGELPLWNPHQQLGGPFLATLQAGALYPPNALHLALPSQRAFTWLVAAHLALAAAGALALARACGAGPAGAAAAGLLHAGSLQLWSSMWAPPTLYTAAWMPVVLAAALRAIDRPSPGRAAGFGLALAMQVLVGWPYTVVMTALTGAALAGAALAARAWRERRPPVGALAALAGGALVAVGLAAPQLAPSLELLGHSARAAGTLDPITAGAELTTHEPGAVLQRLLQTGTSAAVPGLAAPVLALAALALAGPGRLRAAVLLLAGLTALAASFPGHLPVYDAVRGLPLLGDFRFPFRYRLVTSLALAVCAGVGVSRLAARAGRARRGVAAAALCAAAVLVEAVPMARYYGDLTRRFPRREAPPPDLLAPLLAVVGQPEHAASRSLWLVSGADRLGQTAGIRVLQDLEPLSLATTSRLVQFLGTGDAGVVAGDPGLVRPVFGAPYAGTPVLPATPERAALLDLLAVRFAVLARRPPDWLAADWRLVPAGPRTPRLFENPRALPRAWRAAQAEPEPADPQAALERLLAPGFDLRTTVLLAPLPAALRAAAGPDPDAWARIEQDDPEQVVVRTRGGAAGVLVLADAWYPGWEVTVDGAPAEALRADTALRGVAVPAGESVVAWRYRPRSFRLGVAAAAVTGLGLAGLLLGARRRAR